MNATEYVNQPGLIRVLISTSTTADHVWCPIKVLAAEAKYGRMHLTVTPVGGSGETVVTSQRVYFSDPAINHCKETPNASK